MIMQVIDRLAGGYKSRLMCRQWLYTTGDGGSAGGVATLYHAAMYLGSDGHRVMLTDFGT